MNFLANLYSTGHLKNLNLQRNLEIKMNIIFKNLLDVAVEPKALLKLWAPKRA